MAGFKRPDAYPRSALAVVSTHDLPTFRGWWRGLDIDLRQTLGVFDPEVSERERTARGVERHRLAQVLAEEGLLASAEAPEQPPLVEIVRYLARTSSSLAALRWRTPAGELNQANMPGLDSGHPNWRRRPQQRHRDARRAGGRSRQARGGHDHRRARHPAGVERARRPAPRAPPTGCSSTRNSTFDDATKIVPYLARLGVSHVYASPIQKARPGSTHGYDIVDHAAINPELGGEEGFSCACPAR
jgi:(1->4)-alpha-D-glucan 1-alpha-D-glucosylmutase